MNQSLFATIGLAVAIWQAAATLILAAGQRPNILFFFTDDQPQNCLGVTGNDHIETPHLDALARRGTLFDNAFVTTAICCSSRASILTGQHLSRHGIDDFKKPLSAVAFGQSYPAILRKAGYRTGYLGKYAIGNPGIGQRDLSLPAERFDDWYGFPQNISFRQVVDGEPRFLTSLMTERALAFLRAAEPDRPFCLTVAFKEPHGPFNFFDPEAPDPYENAQLPVPATFSPEAWNSQPEFIRKSLNGDGGRRRLDDPDRLQRELRTFYRTVTRADAAVGAILQELARLGLDENTVVIFSSDHGSLLGDHGLTGKWLMYENSIRVPLIIFDPRADPQAARGRRDEIALNIDLAPTMLSIAGLEAPASMQGRDLMPIVRREPVAWRSHFYYQHHYNTNPPRSPIAKSEGIRDRRWKYIRYPEQQPPFEQLFDLESDPLERNNLAPLTEHVVKLAELRALCDSAPARGKWRTDQ